MTDKILEIALHLAEPGLDQCEHELDLPGYRRAQIPVDERHWDIFRSRVRNKVAAAFPPLVSDREMVVTHYSAGHAGEALEVFAFDPPRVFHPGEPMTVRLPPWSIECPPAEAREQDAAAQSDVLAIVQVGCEAVTFKTPSFGELSEITQLLSPVIGAFAGNSEDAMSNCLLAEGDRVTRALALATGREVAWVGGLGIEDFLHLLNAALNTYTTYLTERVFPQVAGMMTGEQGGARP